MVNSYSQKIVVSCPDCQKSITTEVWLIIDLYERRDLRTRIIEDSINLQHCSSCECDFFIDSPLLIYRPGETPTLVFSPAQHSSQENDEEHINFLINILLRNLGSRWRDEWLDNIITVPQSILPDVISEGASDPQQILDRDAEDFNEDFIESILNHLQEEEPSAYKKLSDNVEQLKRLKLLTLLQEFTSNPNQIEARHIVENNPILLSRDADELLGIMEGNAQRDNNEKAVQEFQDYRYLLRRCREVGTLEAFAEKMQTSTEAFQGFENLFKLFPDLSNSIRGLINSGGSNPSVEDVMALISKKPEIFKTINTQSAKLVDETKEMFLQIDQIQQKYIKSEELPELNKTALLVDNVLSNPLLFLVPRDVHCAVLNDASVLYQIQYNISGNQEFFSKSLELLRKCIQKIDPESEDYYKYLPNLGLALIEDYDGNGKIEHFIEAIDIFRKLVTETQETNPKWFLYAGNLATSLYSAYSVCGDINYINEAINISDKALDIITAESNELPSILDISGSILLAYYDLTDDLNTLGNAVQKFQKSVAISSTEGNKIKLAYRMNNFGNGLHKSYLASGNLEQLESAIHNLRIAVTTTTPGTPRWSQYAGNLSAAILSLYQRIGNLDCLRISVKAHRLNGGCRTVKGEEKLTKELYIKCSAWSVEI